MDKNNLKKADFAEYYEIETGTMATHVDSKHRALARVRGDESYCIVTNPERGKYNIIVSDVKSISDLTKYESLIVKKNDNSFALVNFDGNVTCVNEGLQDLTDAKAPTILTGEKFIATHKNGLKSYVSFTRNGGLCRHTQMFQSAEPFDNFGFAKVTDCGPGENNTYLIDKSWERATSYYKDISLPNENGNRLFKVVNGSVKVFDKNFRKIGDYREVYMYDENGKLLPPTSKTPVKDYNGRVGIVDMGRDVLGDVTNFVNALSITEPSKYDVIRLSKYTADGLVQKNIVLREDREQDLLVIDENNEVEDVNFYNALVQSFDKTSGESIYNLDKKYFINENTLNDLKLAFTKYIEMAAASTERIILSGRDIDSLDDEQFDYLNFLIDGRVEMLLDMYNDCYQAKRSESDLHFSLNGTEMHNRSIDEINGPSVEEILDDADYL